MKYFISYAYFLQHGGSGFGNIEVERSWPIAGAEDIEDLTSQITDSLSRTMARDLTLTILGWQQFEADIERVRRNNNGPSNVVRLSPVSSD